VHIFEWLERKVINSSDAVITICPALEDHVRKINQNVLGVMIENFANDDNAERFTDAEVENLRALYMNHAQKIVLYTGTFEPYQGLGLLLASAAQVVRQCPEVAFLLVGGKPEQVQHYQQLIKRVGLSAYFHFTGMRPPEEIPKFVKIATVLVSPRVDGSNTPLKIYQYMRSGKPIVATNIPAHTQVLNSDIAVLADPNPDAFTHAIISAINNVSLTVRLTEQAQQMFRSRYTFQSFVQKTAQVVQMAVK
jgi:glycosyltransferase involved in cell wall biosynthesis